MADKILSEIVDELKLPVAQRKSVPQSRVLRWMESDNADILGATYVFLSKPQHVERIDPPLDFDRAFEFMLRYYAFCLKTDPESKWANSAYSAGADLVGWFVSLWDQHRDTKYLETIKSRLAGLYTSGGPELKKCIEHAVIEHLFERMPIRKFFIDWRENPELRTAYEEGMLWVTRGGKSPLTERNN